ncbi:MAG: hypothetical protein V3R54_02110 [Thermodesulfovibrionia bacterium]
MKLFDTLYNVSLRVKIVGFVTVLLIIAFLLAGFTSASFIRKDVFNVAKNYSYSIAYLLTKELKTQALAKGDPDLIRNFISEYPFSLRKVGSISVLDLDGVNSDAEDRKILQSITSDYTGFIEALDSNYDGIRRMMQKLGLI